MPFWNRSRNGDAPYADLVEAMAARESGWRDADDPALGRAATDLRRRAVGVDPESRRSDAENGYVFQLHDAAPATGRKR